MKKCQAVIGIIFHCVNVQYFNFHSRYFIWFNCKKTIIFQEFVENNEEEIYSKNLEVKNIIFIVTSVKQFFFNIPITGSF